MPGHNKPHPRAPISAVFISQEVETLSAREVKDGNEWSAIDVFELHQYWQRGYSIEEIARFVGRNNQNGGAEVEEHRRAMARARAR